MNSKRKGNAGEIELLNILLDHGIEAHRNDQRYIGGKDNPDISCMIRGKKCHVEVKRKERFNVYEAMNQAISDANGNALPVVAYRKNREQWLIVLPLRDLLDEPS